MTASANDAQRAAFDARVRAIRARGHRAAFEAFGELSDEMAAYRSEAARYRYEELLALWEEASGTLTAFASALGMTKQRVSILLRKAREEAARMSERPEPVPVVAAIVTSRRGVLITRRKDGTPPWGFVAGEIEPGESQADAAVREVKEETGLLVRHGKEVGRRIHPGTGRLMIYMAAAPAGRNLDVYVGDESELAEVRWVRLEYAEAVMPDLFPPVRVYLQRTLGRNR